MTKSLREYRREFEVFTKNIPRNLEVAKGFLDIEELTYSYAEIDDVKALYESNYKSPEKLGLTYDELTGVFDAYIGEAFKHYNGGDWELCTLKKDDAYGKPIILNWGKDDFPHARISTYVWRVRIERGKFRESISEKIKAAQIPMNR